MKKTTLSQIERHALRDAPNEACGFILTMKGKEHVLPVDNVDPDPRKNFSIHPHAYLAAKRQGEIIAVYHSHPEGGPAPTEIDRAGCDRSGLPWYIYSVPEGTMGTCMPAGRAPLLGRSFVWGVYDCWTLVFDYYQERLDIALPGWEPYEEDFWKHGRNYYIERYAAFGFVPVEDLRPHDVLLMQLGADIPVHAGVYQENGTVLHHVPGRLSCYDVYGDYLRQQTTLRLRHRSRL